MDVYVTLRFHHGEKLQQKPRIKYEGGLGFEEAAQPEEPIVGEELGEVLGTISASVGEDLGRASAGVGEDLGRDSVSVGEDLGGTSSATVASDMPEVGSDWESEIEASDDSDNADLSDEGEDEYGSDVHEKVINLRKEKRVAKKNKRKEKGPRSEGVDLGKKGVDLGYDEYLSKKQTTFEGKIAGDKPYFDLDEAVSFEIDIDKDVNEEDEVEQPIRRQRKARRAKRNKKKVVFDPTCQLIVWETVLAFESVKQFREAITRYAVQEHVELDKYVNDATRVRKELNVYVGRIVARKARNIVLKQIIGDHVEEFKRILDYRDELLKTNPGSTCVVRLSEETFEGDRKMFQSFYICFDALKKAFKAGARRCIGFDGCFLKGVSRGQLLVVVCKDGNNQMLPLAWAIVELVRHDLELGDGTELTTITDMQKGLDKAIQDLLPNAEQRMCARHVLAN
ncbi:hypothetical protein KY285_020572 [Solanum tuberosum]|nr:hypothetical protein KY285_020572 [Solanum tuberosum]